MLTLRANITPLTREPQQYALYCRTRSNELVTLGTVAAMDREQAIAFARSRAKVRRIKASGFFVINETYLYETYLDHYAKKEEGSHQGRIWHTRDQAKYDRANW